MGAGAADRAGGDTRSLEAGRPLLGFFVRKAPKDHGTRQRIEGLDVSGKTAVILEDVTTTGGSAMQAVEEVRAAGGTVAAGLIDPRPREGAAELYASRRRAVQIAVPRRRIPPRLASFNLP